MGFIRSIWNDFLYSMRVSNVVTRLVVINFAIFLVALVLYALALILGNEAAFERAILWFCVPASLNRLLWQLWSPITYMFLHIHPFHLIGNLIFLYMFGTVISDLIGPRRVIPLYLVGGLAGALFFMLSAQLLPGTGEYALGASGAVMALAGASVFLAPEYRVGLYFLGEVKLKYIVIFILVLDLVGIAGQYNSGGHAAHIGGFLIGTWFIWAFRRGHDWMEPIQRGLNRLLDWFSGKSANLQRTTRFSEAAKRKEEKKAEELSFQERLDNILDKIKASGLESLTPEEKEFLYNASKKG
ncbi:MAG: rhomboid family intramembrane serine protease [Saprospiraceae bacterium]|nr:rhomboid family intramembrane serine protease [Saprospiraceae bacterium]MDW8483775.1 rhomboid family intramembrane serine protease [Saprospiraceae bacterium]